MLFLLLCDLPVKGRTRAQDRGRKPAAVNGQVTAGLGSVFSKGTKDNVTLDLDPGRTRGNANQFVDIPKYTKLGAVHFIE